MQTISGGTGTRGCIDGGFGGTPTPVKNEMDYITVQL